MNLRFRRCGALAATTALALVLTACGQSTAPDCGKLAASGAWVRVAPEGAQVMGAYFTLNNKGDDKVVINGVNSSQFDRAEMHETVVNDKGQASMQPLEKVTVPAGEKVEFKPGGRHVMLFKPSQTYAAGDQVELILACGTQNAELPVAAVVREQQPGSEATGKTGSKADKGGDEAGQKGAPRADDASGDS